MARKVKDSLARIEELVASSDRRFRRTFLEMVRLMREELNLTQIATLLEQGRVEQALGLLEAAAAKLGVAWSESFTAAGFSTAQHINRHVPVIDFDFDQTNTGAVEAMRRNRLRLIRGFTDQQRLATRQALASGIEQGLNPREQARLFRDSIGLTPYQERIVRNYRRDLIEGNSSALDRELRDRRFDGSARQAVEAGGGLPKTQVERMVERYRQRMINLRAETIARTESLRAVHEGVENTFQQAIEDGVLVQQQLTRTWNSASDSRVRDSHREMDGQKRPFGQPFTTGGGYHLMYPTDPNGPPEETINCRCVVSTTMDVEGADLSGIRLTIQGG